MLRSMRENAGSWIIKVLLGVIVVAFIFMGAGSFNASRASKIATVNGDTITLNQYQRAYYNILDNLRSQLGNQLNDEMIKMFNVKQQALDSVIDSTLLRQAAQRNDVRVTDNELAESITRIPAFQNNGAFDKQRYKILLNQNRLTPETFESIQKEAMLTDKVRSVVTRNAKVSDLEAREWFKWENASMVINYAAFYPSAYQDIEITDKILEEYYNTHKEKYKTEPTRQARYVKFDPSEYKAQLAISDDQIQQYYSDHQQDFKIPETVSARHILFKVAEDATPEAAEEKRQAALGVLEKAKAGEDFAKLAETYSEGPTKENGGQLGTFKREDMVKPFSDKAFSMAPGDISEPVRTQFGWHIIKVEAHNDPSTSPLEDMTAQIREKLLDRKAKNQAYDDAVALYDMTFDGEEFAANAKESGHKLVTTDFFTKSQGPKDVDAATAFAETAFGLPVMGISDISEAGDSFFLIQVIKTEPGKIPELETIKELVAKDAGHEESIKAAETAAKEFLEKAKSSGSLVASAKDTSIEVKSVSLENRNKTSKELDNDQQLVMEAFSLSATKKFSDVIQGKKGFYLLEFKERQEPPIEAFNVSAKNIRNRMITQKQRSMYDSWLNNLRENSEIIISESFMKD